MQTVTITVSLDNIINKNADNLLNEALDILSNKKKITIEEAINRLTDYINANNLNTTPERLKILEQIFNTGEIFYIRDIKIPNGYSISKGTIYNTILLFKKAQIIKQVYTDKPINCFEINTIN